MKRHLKNTEGGICISSCTYALVGGGPVQDLETGVHISDVKIKNKAVIGIAQPTHLIYAEAFTLSGDHQI